MKTLPHSVDSWLYHVENVKTNKTEVMKVLNIAGYEKTVVDKMIETMKQIEALNYSYIVKFTNLCREEDYIITVLPKYYASISVLNPIQTFKTSGIYPATKDLCGCIEVLHANNITHGNIKPNNVLLSEDGHYYLTDYCKNMLYQTSNDHVAINMINASYCCPELLKNIECDISGDIWSLGCVIYFLLTGEHAFSGSNQYDIQKKVLKSVFTYVTAEKHGEFSYVWNELFLKIFVIKRIKRITIQEVMNILQEIPSFKTPVNMPVVLEDVKNEDYSKMDDWDKESLDTKISEYLTDETGSTEMSISGGYMHDVGFEYLTDNFSKMNTITKLDMAGNNISDVGVKYFAPRMKSLPNMVELTLNDNKMTAASVPYLMNYLKEMKYFETLNLKGNKIGDEGVKYICQNIKMLPNLTKLNLSENEISTVGVAYFIQYLPQCPKLYHIELEKNTFSDNEIIKKEVIEKITAAAVSKDLELIL